MLPIDLSCCFSMVADRKLECDLSLSSTQLFVYLFTNTVLFGLFAFADCWMEISFDFSSTMRSFLMSSSSIFLNLTFYMATSSILTRYLLISSAFINLISFFSFSMAY